MNIGNKENDYNIDLTGSHSKNSFTDGTQWESSFSQILNRTRQNISRINQRYGDNSSNFQSLKS
jgi:hypothetical protein